MWSGSKEREAGRDNAGQPFSRTRCDGMEAHVCRGAAGTPGSRTLKAGPEEEAVLTL